jgi:hypothetical protein
VVVAAAAVVAAEAANSRDPSAPATTQHPKAGANDFRSSRDVRTVKLGQRPSSFRFFST